MCLEYHCESIDWMTLDVGSMTLRRWQRWWWSFVDSMKVDLKEFEDGLRYLRRVRNSSPYRLNDRFKRDTIRIDWIVMKRSHHNLAFNRFQLLRRHRIKFPSISIQGSPTKYLHRTRTCELPKIKSFLASFGVTVWFYVTIERWAGISFLSKPSVSFGTDLENGHRCNRLFWATSVWVSIVLVKFC